MFISQDPLGEAQRYVGGNPLGRIDPLGLDWVDDANNFNHGFADAGTFGLSTYLYNKYSNGKTAFGRPADTCSGYFKGGQVTATAASLAAGGASIAKGVLTKVATSGTAASSATNALNLSKALASEAQMGEVGTIIAGQGSKTVFRNAEAIAQRYGGNAANWVKKTSSSFQAKDGVRFEAHWVENIKTGQRVEFKTKFF